MNDEIREQLSALADDELNEMERPLLLGRVQRDATLRECLGRYQLIGEVMRGTGVSIGASVAQRVQNVLANDEPVMASQSASQPEFYPERDTQRAGVQQNVWWKPLAGLAVAASVALVAVLAVTTERNDGTGASSMIAVTHTAPKATLVSDAREARWDRIEPQVEKRLSDYLVNHSEYAASRGVQGVMPYARVVSDTR